MVSANNDCSQIVIDEIQKVPAVLDVVHALMEKFPKKRFVLTGLSAQKLKRAGVDYPEVTRILLYRGEEQIMVDGILVSPVERYLRELVPVNRLPESVWISHAL